MEYKTADLNLAAFLKAKYNLKVLRLEPNPAKQGQAFFVFSLDGNIDIDSCISTYFNEDDVCSINSFMREQTDLKTWINDFKTNLRLNKNG